MFRVYLYFNGDVFVARIMFGIGSYCDPIKFPYSSMCS